MIMWGGCFVVIKKAEQVNVRLLFDALVVDLVWIYGGLSHHAPNQCNGNKDAGGDYPAQTGEDDVA